MSANERARCDVTAASANRVAPVTSPVRVETTPDPGPEKPQAFLFLGAAGKRGRSAGRGARVEIVGATRGWTRVAERLRVRKHAPVWMPG